MPTPGADASRLSPARLLLAAASVAACSPAASTPDERPRPAVTAVTLDGPDPVSFKWPSVQGGDISSADLEGRLSVLVFLTSYDVPSQAQVRVVDRVVRSHVPRINALGVVLEPLDHKPLLEAYASALDLKFGLVMADAATIRGEGAFAGLHHVPSIAILDRKARERFRHLGPMEEDEIVEALRDVEKATGVGGALDKESGEGAGL